MNKTISLIFISITLLFSNVNAQISEGGKPLTMRLFGINNLDSALQVNPNTSSINDLSKTQLRAIKVRQVELAAPDLAPIMKEDKIRNEKTRLYREGVLVKSDISIKSSGNWTILDDGEKIWRLKIHLPGAKAISLYYDHFYLPQGAKYFIFNENGHQVLGAYTSNNNPDDDTWSNEKVQGDLINLELDLPADVDTSSVYMHINEVADFYRATEYLDHYKSIQADKLESTLFPYGGSSPCEINAICPIGSAYPDQRKATVKIEYASGDYIYGISGVCMNNTSQNCIPYVLTASHGEPTNSTSNTTFTNWMFYFNYETPTCNYSDSSAADSSVFYSQTMRGAYFVSRSPYDSSSNAIAGDFLLLQLRQPIPVSYNSYFSGWDNTGTPPTGTCISFHHPSGDVKKVSTTKKVSPYGNFNDGEADSHWALTWDSGYTEEGSSGGGLFEPNSELIGDLTGGLSQNPLCTDTNSSGVEPTTTAEYSKFSLNWYYVHDIDSSIATSLHHWLDPVHGGAAQTLGAIPNTAACIATAIPTIKQSEISVNLYPNPTNGTIFADVSLDKPSDLTIQVYNMIGAIVYEQNIPDVLSGKYSLTIGNQPSGTYLVRLSTASSSITEKIISVNR